MSENSTDPKQEPEEKTPSPPPPKVQKSPVWDEQILPCVSCANSADRDEESRPWISRRDSEEKKE